MWKINLLLLPCFWAICLALPEINPRIIGGHDVDIKKHPYQVSIQIDNDHICGGSIISKNVILTAAHCLNKTTTENTLIIAGTSKWKLINPEHIYKVKELIPHPSYDVYNYRNDIGFIITEQNFYFDETVQPIDFYNEEIEGGDKLVLTGWGLTTPVLPDKPETLKSVELTYATNDVCTNYWKELYDFNTQLCTMDGYGKGGCIGDAGGALTYKNQQVGISSFGYPCAVGYPDVFTDTKGYIDYIKSVINDH